MKWRLLKEKNEVCDIAEIPPETEGEEELEDEKGDDADLGPVD